jgi:hypothetical protein
MCRGAVKRLNLISVKIMKVEVPWNGGVHETPVDAGFASGSLVGRLPGEANAHSRPPAG